MYIILSSILKVELSNFLLHYSNHYLACYFLGISIYAFIFKIWKELKVFSTNKIDTNQNWANNGVAEILLDIIRKTAALYL